MSVRHWSSKFLSLLIAVLCGSQMAFSQIPTPAEKQTKSILFLGATAHIGNGEVIKRSAIGVQDGKIIEVKAAIDIQLDTTKYDTIYHLDGKHIYPGFIAPNSRLGLVEIDAVRASRDFADVGQFNPHVRSITAYNTESRITPTVRSNGVLIAQIAPKGGVLSGSSSIVSLDAWNWEDALIKADDGIHLNWPNPYSKSTKKKEADNNYLKELEELSRFFEEARAYYKTDFILEKNLRFEAMKKLFDGNANLFVHANDVKSITDAIYFSDQFNIKMVLVGGHDAWLVADLLKDREIPVLLRKVHSLPKYEDEDIDLPYRLATLLSQKGVLVGLENSGSMEAMGTRNLPFYAGTTVTYGMSKAEALSLITLNTAKILGIDDMLGSLMEGKQATLFISEGDALDINSNNVTYAFIQGRKINLSNPQKELYIKYSKKYEEN